MGLFEKLSALFGQRGTPEPIATPIPGVERGTIVLDENDECDDLRVEKPVLSGLSTYMAIEYVDAAGKPSTRRITVRRVYYDGRGYLVEAFCHERRAPRNFRLERIREVIDSETGEIFSNPLLYFEENSLLPAKGNFDERKRTNALLNEISPELSALVYLAQTDGRYDDTEVSEIITYAKKFAKAHMRDVSEPLIERYVRRMRPDYESCIDGLYDIADKPEQEIVLFVGAVGAVLEADGKVEQAELEFLAELRDIFEDNDIILDIK